MDPGSEDLESTLHGLVTAGKSFADRWHGRASEGGLQSSRFVGLQRAFTDDFVSMAYFDARCGLYANLAAIENECAGESRCGFLGQTEAARGVGAEGVALSATSRLREQPAAKQPPSALWVMAAGSHLLRYCSSRMRPRH